jgi:hypothetical protein
MGTSPVHAGAIDDGMTTLAPFIVRPERWGVDGGVRPRGRRASNAGDDHIDDARAALA